jgi:hypothetical protein
VYTVSMAVCDTAGQGSIPCGRPTEDATATSAMSRCILSASGAPQPVIGVGRRPYRDAEAFARALPQGALTSRSSVGRVPDLGSGCRRFEPCRLDTDAVRSERERTKKPPKSTDLGGFLA